MSDYIFDKFSGCCSYGGKTLHRGLHGVRHAQGWEVDHGRARANGGVDDNRNKRLACWACNRFKGNLDAQSWQYRIDTYYGGQCPTWRDGDPIRKHP